VATALELGKKTVSMIKRNLFWAFGYNTGLIPIAAWALVPFLGLNVFGWLPILVVVAMALGSVTVGGNSLLLGRYRPRFAAVKPKREQIYCDWELEQVYSPSEAGSATAWKKKRLLRTCSQNLPTFSLFLLSKSAQGCIQRSRCQS
jgi:hypothetical protein